MEITRKTLDEEWVSDFEIIEATSDSQRCFRCQEVFERQEIILLTCDCVAVCSICIYNIFEMNTSQAGSKILTCNCGSPIPCFLFKDHVLLESLKNYLSKLSGHVELPSKYICMCGTESELDSNSLSISCHCCKITVCNRCFQKHENTISCMNNFNLQFMCSKCNNNEKIGMACECKICQNCFISDIKDQIWDDPLRNPTCKMCDKILETQDIYDKFGSKYAFIRFQEDSLLAPRFNCSICNCDKLVDGSITLYCGHRYCKKCVSLYIITVIGSFSAKSTEIQCPECDQNINFHIINSILKGPVFERYQAQLIRNAKSQNSQEVLKFCNTCTYGAYLSVNATVFNCPECQKSICPKCNKQITRNCCQETSLNLKLSLSGSLKNALTKCPKCYEAVIKAGGCNFMKCSWPQCDDSYFCFLCNKTLTVNYI